MIILYEHGPCLVINKPSGILTQAPWGSDSLVVRLKKYLKLRDDTKGDIYLGLPHRLDRPVSGAILFARHIRATRRLASQFEERRVAKAYWAYVEGRVEPDEGTWTDWLYKVHGMAQARVVTEHHPGAKRAVLHYRVMAHLPGGTWLEIDLETGRTHQIRVQAAHRGFPIAGDARYGACQPFGPQHDDVRQRGIALHARHLAFADPMTGKSIDIVAPLPDAWLQLELPVDRRLSKRRRLSPSRCWL